MKEIIETKAPAEAAIRAAFGSQTATAAARPQA